LTGQGYARYEVSAFSKTGRECRHNLNYWRFGDYLGIGAGAHGKLTGPGAGGQVVRRMRQRHPRAYMQHAGGEGVILQEHAVTSDELLFEFLLNHLRLVDGFYLADMERLTGAAPLELQQMMQPVIEGGLLALGRTHCRATERGFRFLNDILLCALPATPI